MKILSQIDPVEPKIQSRLPFLDGLRALAALWVVLGHCHLFAYGWNSHQSIWTKAINALLYLHLGVVVFLVLSGFCLTLPVLRNQNRLSAGVLGFFKARASRILPPYFAILCLILLINFLIPLGTWGRHPIGLTPTISWEILAVNFSLMQDFYPQFNAINGPFWSIATEWHLYFFFPLLVFFLRKFGALIAFALSCILASAIVWIASHPPQFVSNLQMTIMTPSYFLYLFVFGMFAAWLAFGEGYLQRRRKQWLILLPLFAAALVWFVSLMNTYTITDAASATRFAEQAQTIDIVFAVLVSIGLIWIAGRAPHSMVRRLLEGKALTKIGHFSYSLYLVHIPILAITNHLIEKMHLPTNLMHLHFAILVVFGTGLSLVFANIFCKIFESGLWWRWIVGLKNKA